MGRSSRGSRALNLALLHPAGTGWHICAHLISSRTTYPYLPRYAQALCTSPCSPALGFSHLTITPLTPCRTFPEHPLFCLDAGQNALFRVLKAYSVQDKEVGYCQGMAFPAGVLLMYLPQEPAFRLFCRWGEWRTSLPAGMC